MMRRNFVGWEPLVLAFAGISLQVISLLSVSWVSVSLLYNERCGYRRDELRCRSTPIKDRVVVEAGLWEACYDFPDQYNWSQRYCAVFAEDVLPEVWLTMLQTVALLGPIFAGIGSLMLVVTLLPLIRGYLFFSLGWLGSRLFAVSGMSGFIASLFFHLSMTRDFLIQDRSPFYLVLNKNWAFYCYLYGAILTSVAKSLVSDTATRRKHARDRIKIDFYGWS